MTLGAFAWMSLLVPGDAAAASARPRYQAQPAPLAAVVEFDYTVIDGHTPVFAHHVGTLSATLELGRAADGLTVAYTIDAWSFSTRHTWAGPTVALHCGALAGVQQTPPPPTRPLTREYTMGARGDFVSRAKGTPAPCDALEHEFLRDALEIILALPRLPARALVLDRPVRAREEVTSPWLSMRPPAGDTRYTLTAIDRGTLELQIDGEYSAPRPPERRRSYFITAEVGYHARVVFDTKRGAPVSMTADYVSTSCETAYAWGCKEWRGRWRVTFSRAAPASGAAAT